MDGPIRVYFLAHQLGRFVSDFGALPRYLTRRGIAATVFVPEHPRTIRAGWSRPDQIAASRRRLPESTDVRQLPFDREALSLSALLRTAWVVYRVAQKSVAAAYVLCGFVPNVVCGLPLRLLDRPCVFLVTGLGSAFDAPTWRRRWSRFAAASLYRYLFAGKNSRVIVHNHEDRDYLVHELHVARWRVEVTPGCGVDPEEYPWLPPPPPRSRKIVLVPVRLLKEKGVLDAAAASARLRARGIDHEMWFSCSVDPGNPSSLTEPEIEALKRDIPTIRFVGYQPTTQPLYAQCDVVLIPTRYREGLPTAILEAAACGRPIVATDNVGCREFVEDGRTGLLVSPGDPEDMAQALSRLLTDHDLAEDLRRDAYQKFLSGYTKAVMVKKTMDTLAALGVPLRRRPESDRASRPVPPRLQASPAGEIHLHTGSTR